jgi:hypothetical protein
MKIENLKIENEKSLVKQGTRRKVEKFARSCHETDMPLFA